MQPLTDKIGSILSGFRGATSWWNTPPGWSFSMRLHWSPPSIFGALAAGLKKPDLPSHCLYSSLDMSAMVGSGLCRAPDGFQVAAGAASLAFINDNSLYTQSRGNHSTNNEGIQQTIKRAPFFVAQEEAKGGLGLGLNNNLHTNTMLKN